MTKLELTDTFTHLWHMTTDVHHDQLKFMFDAAVEKLQLEELLSNKWLNDDGEMPVPETQTEEQATQLLIKYFEDIKDALTTLKNRAQNK